MGDDLLVTNPKRIATAIEKKACSALLLKVRGEGLASRARAAGTPQFFARTLRFVAFDPVLDPVQVVIVCLRY